MSKFNLKEPYGTVYGHDSARYEQNGLLYDAQYKPLIPEPPKPKTKAVTPAVDAAAAFLLQILKENPLSKSAIYKEAEANNQDWESVRNAALTLNIGKFQKNNLEMWRLPESSGV
jgi:hypothetical protein